MIENNVTSFLPVHWSHFTVAIFIFNSFFTFLPFFDAQNSFFILYCEKKCLMSWDDLIKWMEKGSLRLKTKMQFSIFLQDQKKMFTSLKRFDIAWKYVKIFLISKDCWTYFVYNGSKYIASPFSTKWKLELWKLIKQLFLHVTVENMFLYVSESVCQICFDSSPIHYRKIMFFQM